MRIFHRFFFRISEVQRRQLEDLRVKVPWDQEAPPGSVQLQAVDVAEDDPHWAEVSRLMTSWDAGETMVYTKFTKKEIDDAAWLDFGTTTHTGYPQPDEDDDGYVEATYDMSEACEKCGIGRRQKAAFQMKREPAWGAKGLLQMNWVFDEVFARPDVWEDIFAPLGVKSRPVEDVRGNELSNVVQLVIDEVVGVAAEGHRSWECPACGRTLYYPPTRGPFPALTEEADGVMVRTREYFSGGGWGFRYPLMRGDLARALRDAKVRGVWYKPLAAGGAGE